MGLYYGVKTRAHRAENIAHLGEKMFVHRWGENMGTFNSEFWGNRTAHFGVHENLGPF